MGGWESLKGGCPSLAKYASLEEAQREHTIDSTLDEHTYNVQRCMEEVFMKPIFNLSPIKDMGRNVYSRRVTENSLVGFLSSVSSERFLSLMGEASQRDVGKQTYTGFWMIDDKDQTSGPSAMFGGPELMKEIEDFIAVGSKPAYIGWGSCVGFIRGKSWMCVLAVSALKEAGMRGIILGGWAELSFELLEEIVGPDDKMGLCAYAKKNIMFIQKAPQTWLFPKCSVLVMHGGVGTLAVGWQSGVPVIIVPVWFDQFQNGWLNSLMGAGVTAEPVDNIDPYSLAQAMKHASTSADVKRGAQAVQFSMYRDKGIQKAIDHIHKFMTQEVASGRWKERWLHTSPA